jgi:hypothetical protein
MTRLLDVFLMSCPMTEEARHFLAARARQLAHAFAEGLCII